MINFRHISGLLIIILMSIYFLFGDVDNVYWSGFYFALWNYTTVYLGAHALRRYRDRLYRIIIKTIMGVSFSKLLFSLSSFVDPFVYEKINSSYEAGGVVVGCVLIFVIYSKNERLVKK